MVWFVLAQVFTLVLEMFALRGPVLATNPIRAQTRMEYPNPIARCRLYSALQNITCSDQLRRDDHVGNDFQLREGDRSEGHTVA